MKKIILPYVSFTMIKMKSNFFLNSNYIIRFSKYLNLLNNLFIIINKFGHSPTLYKNERKHISARISIQNNPRGPGFK